MCGRFTQQRSDHELAQWFEAEALLDDPGGRFNVAPTDPVSIVVEKDDRRAITAYRWGLVPFWAKDRSIGSRHINARAETLASSSVFRESFARRRCLVPADGFYEWRRDPGRRQPFVFRRIDRAPLAFAGLWSGWRDRATCEGLRTMTIVTTGANELMAPIHDRMPVVLPPEAWSLWLDPTLEDIAELQGLLVPAPEADLEAFAVETLVNNVRNNGPELIVPLASVPGALPTSVRAGPPGLFDALEPTERPA
jgi:putative SOS response-associated peptidase YedK